MRQSRDVVYAPRHPDRFYPVVDTVAWLAQLASLGVRSVQPRAKDLSHE
jgi:thiamine-phosphate pyrophosphorylase